MKCKKCGAQNRDGAKFCCECGNKLEIINYCDNCGCRLEEGAVFCDQCGARVGGKTIEKAQEKSTSSVKNVKTTNELQNCENGSHVNKECSCNNQRNIFSKVTELILKIIVIVFCSFAMLSMFGAFASAENTQYGLEYWFKDGWKIFETTQDAIIAQQTVFIFQFLLFLASFVLVVVFSIISIVKVCTQFGSRKFEKISCLKSVSIVAGTALTYFVMERFAVDCIVAYSGRIISVEYGWGAIIFTTFLSLFVCALIVKKVADTVENKGNIAICITKEILLFSFASSFILSGWNSLVAAGTSTEYYGFTALSFFQSFLGATFGSGDVPSVSLMLDIFAIIGCIGSFVIILELFKSLIKGDSKRSSGTRLIVMSSVSVSVLILSLVLEILSSNSYLDFCNYPMSVNSFVTPNGIVTIIFGVLLVATTIVFKCIQSKKIITVSE